MKKKIQINMTIKEIDDKLKTLDFYNDLWIGTFLGFNFIIDKRLFHIKRK